MSVKFVDSVLNKQQYRQFGLVLVYSWQNS